jgi:hypothetical protein
METTVEKVKAEFVKGEDKVKAFEKVLAQKVVRAADAVEQKVSDTEELLLRRLENEFLKAKIEIENFQKRAMELQKAFGERITGLALKYELDLKTWTLDSAAFIFRKIPQAQLDVQAAQVAAQTAAQTAAQAQTAPAGAAASQVAATDQVAPVVQMHTVKK